MLVFGTDFEDLTLFGLSTNLHEQSQNGTQACDKTIRKTDFKHFHTNDFRQCCHVGNTAQHCRGGLFQDSDFAGDFEDSKPTSVGVLCIFGSRTFCHHQLDVPEANISIPQFYRI